MRLLHSTKFEFEEFFDSNIPDYAILSHRWQADEVNHQDYLTGQKPDGAGAIKIRKCCEFAAKEDYEWVWIDTCCIDQKSSAELSEAINSMYRWYQDARVCYAYLSDVSANTTSTFPGEDFGPWEESFKKSVWFRRGWTLQELLAPKKLFFLDQNWQVIGTKSTLSEQISAVTGIDVQVCRGTKSVRSFSVAQKMSWAAGRETSRVEDIAYCLLGIFDINMPLLYGEGAKAFLRLQEEIIRNSDDESVFAWNAGAEARGGLLALSPRHFADCRDVRVQHFDDRRPYLITNRGLQMDVPLLEPPGARQGTFLVPLSCSKDRQSPLALVVHKGNLVNDRFVRKECLDIRSAGFKDQTWSFEDSGRRVIDVYLRPRW